MRFRPKFDWWQMLIVAGTPIAVIVIAAVSLQPVGLQALALAIGTVMLWGVLSTHYQVKDDALVVASGPFRIRYPWSRMRRVRKGGWWAQVSSFREPRLRMAFSTDNLILEFGDGRATRRVVVSPQHKDQFLREVLSRAPGVVLEGL